MEKLSINIASFFEIIILGANEENKNTVNNLKESYKYASQQLKADFDDLFENEIKTTAFQLLKRIDEISEELDDNKTQQKKYLGEFKKKVLKYVLVPDESEDDYPEIFINNSLQFFINALKHFNVIDRYCQAKRGFPAICESMLRNKIYRDNVFRNNLTTPEFIIFLNSYFNAKIKAKDKLSDGWRYDSKITEYFNSNFDQ